MKSIAEQLIEAKTQKTAKQYLAEQVNAGRTARAISIEIGLSHVTIAKMLRKYGHKPKSGWVEDQVA